jgi:prepilin-type N-terminal cleavage/methylation domain-containing protein
MRTFLVVLVLLTGAFFPPSGSAAEALPVAKSETIPAERAANSELKQALARLAEERNEIRVANDKLQDQRWLLIIYAGVMTLLAGWLGLRLLARPQTTSETTNDTEAFPADDGTAVTTRRKNATITIRNGATQEAEVTERVQTRRYFNRGDTATLVKRTEPVAQAPRTTTRIERRTETHVAPATRDPTPTPMPQVVPIEQPSERRKETSSFPTESRPATVRVEHRSDRLEQVALKPGTAVTARTTRKAFTLIEVMISVAVLATVLMAAFSGTYTLRQVQRANQEQSQVEELAANLAERIMGANWDWLGRYRPNEPGIDHRKGAWSWHRRENSQTYSASDQRFLAENATNPDHDLVTVGILQQKTGIPGLKVYLEYYHAAALDEVFTAGSGEAPYARWQAMQNDPALVRDYILPESEQAMDLREETKAVVVRILVTWHGYLGSDRRHELIFARRK